MDKTYRNDGGKKRKPDIRFQFLGRQFVFEIQLATTQRPIITDRNEFYLAEGMSIIWLTWKPDDRILRDHKASVIDIITDHNDNLFSVDPETFSATKQTGIPMLRVHWWEDAKCLNKIVPLDELIYPDDGLPYSVAKPQEWHEAHKDLWVKAGLGRRLSWPDIDRLWPILIERVDPKIDRSRSSIDHEAISLLCVLLTLERHWIIGSQQKNIAEVLHTFLSTQGRKPMARILEHAIFITGNDELLEREKTKLLMAEAKKTPQVSKDSLGAQIARTLFPNWAVPRKGGTA